MAKQKIDTRSDCKKAKDAAYAALPPLKILKPLRWLRDNTCTVELDHTTVPARPVTVMSQFYKDAKRFAAAGQGAIVSAMAAYHYETRRTA